VITPDQLGNDEDLAREVLIIGRDIAPCLDSFADNSEEQKNALAILRRVYKDIVGRGARYVKAQRIAGASVDYGDIGSAFDGQPTRALRAICASEAPTGGIPQGSFPKPAHVITQMWPEET
jgi:hypothetical protein